jgi:lipoprotein
MEVFMFKKILILLLAAFLFSCKQHTQNIQKETNGATVIFSSLQEGRGEVVALVDGKRIKSGDKVAKGKVVSFTAIPKSGRYIIRRWKGASYSEDTIDEALLMIKDEKAIYTIRADFGSIVNFMRINSGEVKGVPVVADLTKAQIDKIVEGNQTIKVKGTSVSIVVASTDVTWDANSFKVNGQEKHSMAYDIYKSAGVVTFENLEVGKPFKVECSQSVASNVFNFNFNLLREDGLTDTPRLHLAIDEKKPEPLTKTTLQDMSNGKKPHFYSKKDPEIEVSSTLDVVKEVVLQDIKKGTSQTLTPSVQNLAIGKKYFTRFYINDVPYEDSGEPREIKIIVKPKEADKYDEVIWEFCLKQLDEVDSAEFQGTVNGIGKFSPTIIYGIKWYDGKAHKLIDDYGAKSLTLTAHTISAEAKVYYQIVDIDGKPFNNSEEKLMINKNDVAHSHKSEEIILFDDKPTHIKMWVVSKTGKKRNDDRGLYYFTSNPITMRWGYSFTDDPSKAQGTEYNEGYDVINIDKDEVKNGKVYVSFGIWDAFDVDTKGLAPEQKPFIKMKLNEANIQEQWYTTEVNISKLVGDNKGCVEIYLPITEKGVNCFTYKVVLRLK